MRVVLVGVAAFIASPINVVHAQDSTVRGISLIGRYDPGERIGVRVLPVKGSGGDSIRTMIERDLDFSDRFAMSAMTASDSLDRALQERAYIDGLRASGVAFAVQVTSTATGAHVALYDVAKEQISRVEDFSVPRNTLSREWRLAIHRVADEIELWITGQRGIAASRIAYVRNGTIRLIDSDGAGETSLAVEENSLSPAWSRSGNTIAYATYGNDSRLWLLNVATGRSRSILGPTRNVSYSAPAFTSGDERLTFGRLTDTSNEIWSVLIEDPTQAQRITRARGESASMPSPSPNDRRVAYVTDILGHPEIYVSDVAGLEAELLTDYPSTGKAYRAEPDWSPNGMFIAYQEMIASRFQIRVIAATGRVQPKTLTDDGVNEQPSWAPDSRHVVFTSTRTGVRELWVVDTQSGRFRQLTRAPGARLGAWSPRLAQP